MDQTSPAPSASSQVTEFVPVQGGTDSVSAEGMLVAAYIVMWAVVVAFAWLTWRRQETARTRLEALEKTVARLEQGRDEGAT